MTNNVVPLGDSQKVVDISTLEVRRRIRSFEPATMASVCPFPSPAMQLSSYAYLKSYFGGDGALKDRAHRKLHGFVADWLAENKDLSKDFLEAEIKGLGLLVEYPK